MESTPTTWRTEPFSFRTSSAKGFRRVLGALRLGAKPDERAFSGKFDFIETSFVYPTTHMVVPKERSLACEECHADEARLPNLT